MILSGVLGWTISLLLLPTLWLFVDAIGGFRARHSAAMAVGTCSVKDFTILVPIYGDVRYLENVEFLAQYSHRVVLCTTTNESDEFNRQLTSIAYLHGFQVFRAAAAVLESHSSTRSTGGTVRDSIIRSVLPTVTTESVVCIDADTTTVQPLGLLVGALETRGLDLASIRLVPSNSNESVLTRLQTYEYRLSMRMRIIAPWLVSGACHAARTEVLRDVMSHHSLFFQGNDVETGLLAEAMGFKVGHVPFEVPTTVPVRLKPWWRQHLAWAGGEFRLFFVNARIGLRHPFFWTYGLVITLLALPLRWNGLIHFGYVVGSVVVLYLVLSLYLHWPNRGWTIILMPFYSAFVSLILVPLGVISYIYMAIVARNAGIIRVPTQLDSGPRSLRASVYRRES